MKKIIIAIAISIVLTSFSGCKGHLNENLHLSLGGDSGKLQPLLYRIIKKIRGLEPTIWKKLKTFFGVKELWGEIKLELFFFKGSVLKCSLIYSHLKAYGKGESETKFDLCKFLQTSDWMFTQHLKPFSISIILKREKRQISPTDHRISTTDHRKRERLHNKDKN